MDLNALMRAVYECGGTDLHLKLGMPPVVRRDGALTAVDGWEPLSERDLESALQTVTARTPHRLEDFRETGELDTSYMAPDLARFRVNAFKQRGATSFAFRLIPNEIPKFEDLRLPTGVQKMAEEHRGLVLVTGATGSGKSTTLAALLGHINRTRRQHIVTIEDPIEFLHTDHGCIVNQREVGLDTDSFQQALPRAGGGRIAAFEVMVNNARIADLIREDKAEDIHEAIAEGAFFHMQTFSQALIELVLSGEIDREIAANAATNKHDFLVSLEHALKRKGAAEREEAKAAAAAEAPDLELRVIAPTDG